MWIVWFREDVNHGDDNTTSIFEGYHSSLKHQIPADLGEYKRVDRLCDTLLVDFQGEFVHRTVRSVVGVACIYSSDTLFETMHGMAP